MGVSRYSQKADAQFKNLCFTEVFAGFHGEESELIPILQKTQEILGYVSEESICKIARFLKLSENQVYGVSSFYSQFRLQKPGRNTVKICMGTACHVKGGQTLSEALERELNVSPEETTEDGRFDLQRVACLGCCALAPVVQVNEEIHSQVSVADIKKILEQYQ